MFERDRYDWNINLRSDLNESFPTVHTSGPEYAVNILFEPQTAFHVPQIQRFCPQTSLLVTAYRTRPRAIHGRYVPIILQFPEQQLGSF